MSEEFSIRQVFAKMAESGSANALRNLDLLQERANGGDDNAKFKQAFVLTGMVTMDDYQERLAPYGLTEEIKQQTLAQCLSVFRELAARNHPEASVRMGWCYARGFGCAADIDQAKTWLAKGRSLGADPEHVKALENCIGATEFLNSCRGSDPSPGA